MERALWLSIMWSWVNVASGFPKSDNVKCTKAIHGQVLIDTVDQPLIDTWTTLHWHFGWHLIDILVDSQLTFDRCRWVSLLLVDYQLTVEQVLTEYCLGCQSSTDADVLSISVDTWLCMSLVQMTQVISKNLFRHMWLLKLTSLHTIKTMILPCTIKDFAKLSKEIPGMLGMLLDFKMSYIFHYFGVPWS